MTEKSSDKKGLYIHIPFCLSKCAYCDFYSLPKINDEILDSYVEALIRESEKYEGVMCDTLYIGGGTPTLLGGQRIYKLVNKMRERFGDFTEATLEGNPADELFDTFNWAKKAGINRVSLGVQGSNEKELKALSRRHTNGEVKNAVATARASGINNISLDLMLGIPYQTADSLSRSIDFLLSLSPQHISAYMLSLESGTPLCENRDRYPFPSEDEVCGLYHFASEKLKSNGFCRYEISNFSKEGYESRHNLKYWKSGEYIGLGAAAHGFLKGRRYCYEKDLNKFINAPEITDMGEGTDAEMFAALRLRLSEGLDISEFEKLYGSLPAAFFEKAKYLQKNGFCEIYGNRLKITEKGILISNKIISELLYEL